jgi:fucose 4-O-acetylase-like acetyltransferase
MVSTRLLASWLLLIGIIWVLAASWTFLALSGISVPIVSLPLLLLLYYGAPLVLIFGSSLVLARRSPRVGAILAVVACAYLSYLLAPEYISFLQPKPPLEAPRPYIFFAVLGLMLIVTDAAAVTMAVRIAKASNQAMQRTAPRSDA